MNTKIHIVFFLITCITFSVLAQETNTISDPSEKFTYNGKPISPEMLIPFFPSPVDSSSEKSVDLSRAVQYRSERDTLWVRGLKWVNAPQAEAAYTCATDFGFVNYIVLHHPSPNRFVVLSCMNNGGTFTQCYTFVLDIRGDRLIKAGGIKTDNVKEYAVDMRGNSIYYDKASYDLPSLTH